MKAAFALLIVGLILVSLSDTQQMLHAQEASPQSAQTLIEMEDVNNPPAGFVSPRPSGSRDLSMANYPRESFIAGEEGRVSLRLLVQTDGSVGDAKVEMSSGFSRLDAAALELVKGWRYEPAKQGDNPVAARFPVIVDWKLALLPFEFPGDAFAALARAGFYPPISIRLRETGRVGVRFLVDSDGKVANVVVTEPTKFPRLNDATIRMIKAYWRFKPAMLLDGSPVGTWHETSITFNVR